MSEQNEMNFPQETPEDVENWKEPMEPASLPIENEPQPEQAEAAAAPQKAKGTQSKKTGGPVYVGRITLGLALIAVGILITVSLFVPDISLLSVAKFAPLVLVLVGAEVLIGAARSKGRPVKVGFGLTFLSLILIFGAVGAAVLPEAWEEYGPARWEREEESNRTVTQTIYDRVDLSVVDNVHVDVFNSRSEQTPIVNARLTLLDDYEDAATFAADSLGVVQALKDMELNSLNISAKGPGSTWELYLDAGPNLANLTPEQLQKRVVQNRVIVDAEMNEVVVSQQRYEEMSEKGLLVSVDALKTAHEKGCQEGYEEARRELEEERSGQENGQDTPSALSQEEAGEPQPTETSQPEGQAA